MHWRWALLFGLFQRVGQFGFLFMRLKVGITAGLASILLQTQVLLPPCLALYCSVKKTGFPLKLRMVLAALGLACFAVNYMGHRLPPAAQ